MKTPTFFLFSLMALCASAHMQLSKPYPIRSPLNKDAKGPKDYSYTSPLSPSGDNFPCKGYAKDAFQSTADYTAGKQYQMTVAGSATHGGGSCQISLSYDQGQTFKVIHSMLGGCPLKDSYDFSIPPDAPAGQALLAWTWFNKIGNREMYMNCAQVTIHSSDSKKMMNRNHRRHHLAARSLDHRAAATPFKQLPAMFVANVNKEGQCTTVESKEVNFPLPGDSVEGKLSDKGYTCKSSAPFLGDKKQQGEISSPSEGGSSPPSSSSQPGSPSHAAGGVPGAFYPSSSMAVNPSSSSNSPLASQSTPAASSSSSPTPGSGGSCSQGSIACSSDGKSWTMCQNGSPGAMRPVAAGTLCKNGALVAA